MPGSRIAGPIVALVALATLLLAACSNRVSPSESLFPELLSKDPERPLEIVAQKTFTRADEAPRDARDALASGNSRYLRDVATFTSQPGKGPLHVVLDYAGFEIEKVEYPEHREVSAAVSVACPGLKVGCSEKRLDVWPAQLRFYTGALNATGVSRRDVYVDGTWRRAYLGHESVATAVAPGVSATLYVAFKPPPRLDTYQLRVTAFYGDHVFKRPSRIPAVAREYARYGGVAALALIVLTWWRRARNEEAYGSDDPPKRLGALIAFLGFLALGVGVAMNDWYMMVGGTLVTCTGMFLWFGLRAARLTMTIHVIFVYAVAFTDLGFTIRRELFMHAALPTVIWIYILLDRVSNRLGYAHPRPREA